jgi:lipopolysaccharide/colanic/teichoic acid biosynthesis glycosyltransferase
MEVHQWGSLPLLSVAGPRIAGLEGLLKRFLDLALVLIALPFALPVSLGVAAWLVTVRRLPPLVRKKVIAGSHCEFTMYTFPPLPELQGRHLWRLPALFNVLRGDLSFVGPRPIFSTSTLEYRQWRVMLTSVRPGLTGPWWLLSGSRRLSIANEVVADLAYIRSYSIWVDVRLVAATARRLLKRGWTSPSTPAGEAEASTVASPAVTTLSGGMQ